MWWILGFLIAAGLCIQFPITVALLIGMFLLYALAPQVYGNLHGDHAVYFTMAVIGVGIVVDSYVRHVRAEAEARRAIDAKAREQIAVEKRVNEIRGDGRELFRTATEGSGIRLIAERIKTKETNSFSLFSGAWVIGGIAIAGFVAWAAYFSNGRSLPPTVTVDNPSISCGSGGCFPLDDSPAAQSAANRANEWNRRAAEEAKKRVLAGTGTSQASSSYAIQDQVVRTANAPILRGVGDPGIDPNPLSVQRAFYPCIKDRAEALGLQAREAADRGDVGPILSFDYQRDIFSPCQTLSGESPPAGWSRSSGNSVMWWQHPAFPDVH